ncbi:alpha/beta fold hydrolase [Nonomuraea spiralis]|uniref:alpha/beta fold hydrolase n=1 Tax=Nonomuraea spiralis TaxID=46182 RepID=UPI00378FD2E9
MPDIDGKPPPRLAATEREPPGAADRPPLVLLHGLGCERGQFVRQWEGLRPELRLLGLDLPGHGGSPGLESGTYSVRAMADAVAADLDARGLRGVVLGGHSAGGLIATLVAVTRPALVSGVLVLDSNFALTAADRRVNEVRAHESASGDWRGHFLAAMSDAWGPGGAGGDGRAEVFRSLERTPEQVVRPLWHDILRFDPTDLCRRCPVPMLYVRSRRDTDLAVLRSLNPLISVADLRPRCRGHWPQLQCPDVVNDLIHTFLTELTELTEDA